MNNVREFMSPNGFPVLVGKNSTGNDYISHMLAQPDDTWFHAHNVPGCHVIMRDGSHLKEDIQFAGQCALKVPGYVSVTKAKNVHRTKTKGLVRLTEYTMIFLPSK